MPSDLSLPLAAYFKSDCREAGLDEAGRGCLAGPVTAAAVVLPCDYFHPLLNDSKKLNPKQREELRFEIEREAIAWQVAFVDNEEIDKINILNASFLAMNLAVDRLDLVPDHLIIDGHMFRPSPTNKIPYACVIKGDGKYFSIAAASILAKTYRDEFMESLHQSFPHYDWGNNKGYPTVRHRDGIKQYGITTHHRKSFALLPGQLELF